MKVAAIILGVILAAGYVDHQYYNGRYFHVLLTMSRQIALYFGLR